MRLLWEARDLAQLNAQILALSKKRGQLKAAITDMVQLAITWIPQLPSKAEKEELVLSLKAVVDGKIYVEVERARITVELAGMREAEGRLAEASETLQEVAVETFGSMEKKEKVEILLEQVRAPPPPPPPSLSPSTPLPKSACAAPRPPTNLRPTPAAQIRLTLAQRDFSRMGILSNKVNKTLLAEAGMEPLRLRFYALCSQLAHHNRDALSLAKQAREVLATRGHAEDAALWKPALEAVIVFLALAPWDNEVSDGLARVKADRRLEELAPHWRALVGFLTTPELAPWPLPPVVEAGIMAHPAFSVALDAIGGPAASKYPASAAPAAPAGGGAAAAPALTGAAVARSSIVLAEDEARVPLWAPLLRKRLLQHNLRVIGGVYSRATLARLCQLTAVDSPTLEAQLCELVAKKAVAARIDRPAGTVDFGEQKTAVDTLSGWASDVNSCMARVEKVVHLLRKEQQQAAAAKGKR